MTGFRSFSLGVSGGVVLLFSLLSPAYGEGISREQGDVLISELRQIRMLLEKQQRPAEVPAPAPAPEKVRLKLGKEEVLGSADAPVVMLEYTDFQCPYCSRFHTGTFPDLKKKYIDTGKIRFVSRDFPLEFHQFATKAAEAAHCAGDQGKYWEMKDALMTNSAQLSVDMIESLARKNSLDMERFQGCMDRHEHLEGIKDEVAAAGPVGINGTPSFIIGRMEGDYLVGTLVVGAQPLTEFEKAIREYFPSK